MKPHAVNVSQRLRTALIARGIGYTEFARRLGVSTATVTAWTRGKLVPQHDISRIAHLLKLDWRTERVWADQARIDRDGDAIYRGQPCSHCERVTRYWATRGCVHCHTTGVIPSDVTIRHRVVLVADRRPYSKPPLQRPERAPLPSTARPFSPAVER